MTFTEAERAEVLRRTIAYEVTWNGAGVETVGSFMAVLVYARKNNYPLHAFLSVLTCGVWLIVWVFLMKFEKREYRKVIRVDTHGRVMWG
jgi:hypothetical protein